MFFDYSKCYDRLYYLKRLNKNAILIAAFYSRELSDALTASDDMSELQPEMFWMKKVSLLVMRSLLMIRENRIQITQIKGIRIKDTGEEEGQTKETKERVTLRPGSVRVLHDFDKFTQNTDLRIGEVFYLDDRSVGIGRGSSENIVRGCVIDISQRDQALQTGVTLRFLISAD